MTSKLHDTFKQTADTIAFLDRGYGVGKPDVQSAIEKVYSEINRETPTLEIVSVKDFGAVGDGETDDHQAILNAIMSSDTIYFPPGVYGMARTLELRDISNKTLIFDPKAVLYRLPNTIDNDLAKSCLHLTDCYHMTIHNLTADSGLEACNTLVVVQGSGSHHIKFTGVTTVKYSKSWTFVLRHGANHIYIQTLVVEQPDDKPPTLDGIDIVSANNVTIDTVIGIGDNGDDLVALKSFGPPCFNIQIGKILAYGTYGVFSIGSEILGDIYNVTVGEIVAVNTQRGIYFKLWDNSSTWPDIPLEDYGNIYNIHIGSFSAQCLEPGRSFSQITFHIHNIPEFKHKYRDIHIGNVYIEGSVWNDFAHIMKVKNLFINNLITKVNIPAEEEREDVSRFAVYIDGDSENITINGGYLESLDHNVRIYNASGDYSNTVRVKNTKFVRVNREGEMVTDKVNVWLSSAYNVLIEGCVFTSDYQLEAPWGTPSAVRRTCRLTNNIGREIGLTSPPTSGYWEAGEIIYNASDNPTPLGWLCTSRGNFNDPNVPDPVFTPIYAYFGEQQE